MTSSLRSYVASIARTVHRRRSARAAATLRALLTLLDPDDVALSVDVDTEDFHEVWATIWPRRPQGVTLQ